MLTGIDQMVMTFYDASVPHNPASYNPHQHFQNRITSDDARSVGIADACKGFEENRRQLVSLAHLPAEAFLYSIRFQKLKKAINQGKRTPKNFYVKGQPAQALFSKLSAGLRDCMDGTAKFPSLSQQDLAPYHHVAGMARLGNPEWVGPSIKAFAISIVSQCWQTYEVLTVDLATDAISNNRSKFSNVKLPVEIFRGPGGRDKGIRDTYRRIFGPSASGIMTALADQHLDYAFAIKNLLSHKAGKTDQKYLDAANKLTLDKIIRPKLGHEFPLTGELVNSLGNHCFAMGYYLLREVYLWLKQ